MLARPKIIRITASALAGIIVLLVGAGTWNALRPLPTITARIGTLPSVRDSTSLTWPHAGEAAIGAMGYGVLANSGTQQRLPTASVAKVVVGLAVLEKLPLKVGEQGAIFHVGAADVARYNDYVARGGSVIPVVVGEDITEYQALQALMLPSANNIADSLAIWVFGSLDNYFAYANAMVQRLGMPHTTLAGDASGLSPQTVSTPEDLVRLGQAALSQPVLAQIVNQKTADLPVAGQVFNYNALLGSHGISGIKTGNSDEAGGCFLFAATYVIGQTPVTVVGAIMGATDLNGALSSSLPLLDAAKANFSVVTPVHKDAVVATYTLPWGGEVHAVAKTDVSVLHWAGTPITSEAEAQPIKGAQLKNSKLGRLQFQAGPIHTSTDVVLQDALPAPSLWWRITRH